MRKSRYIFDSKDSPIWASYTDLMSNAFMILTLFLIIAFFKAMELNYKINKIEEAPPVLLIRDSGEYKFESGSAVLPSELAKFINTNLVTQIEEITQKHDIYVVEIIGHTDGQPNGFITSNLDQNLEKVTLGNESVSILKAGSNADLGLMRALEVMRQLQDIQQKGRLKGLEFRAYSAAQLFLPSGEFAPQNRNADATRRRIEIRFSPLGEAKTIGE